eukprot:2130901-Rhodomonas_salina.2
MTRNRACAPPTCKTRILSKQICCMTRPTSALELDRSKQGKVWTACYTLVSEQNSAVSTSPSNAAI